MPPAAATTIAVLGPQLQDGAMHSFHELVAEADQVPVDGSDFSWLHARAAEERPHMGQAPAA